MLVVQVKIQTKGYWALATFRSFPQVYKSEKVNIQDLQ